MTNFMTYNHSRNTALVHHPVPHLQPPLSIPLTSVSILLLGLLILPPVPQEAVTLWYLYVLFHQFEKLNDLLPCTNYDSTQRLEALIA